MKNLVLLLVLAIAVVAVFGIGYHLRSAEMVQPVQQASVAFNSRTGSGADMVTARPPASSSFLPAAVAAESDPPAPSDSSGSSESDADRQIDDLLNSDSPAATFQQVYLLLKDQFVDNIDSDDPLAHGAASAMLASLDEPNSRFVDSDERSALEQQASGLFEGTGAVFTVRVVKRNGSLVDRQITVIDSIPGSPADKAGLKTGDVVTTIDGHWVVSYDPFQAQADQFKKLANDPFDLDAAVDATEKKITDGFTLDKAQSLLDTTVGSPLRLTIQRPGEPKPFDVILDVSVPTQVKDIEFRKLDDGNGYIAFNAITDSTATDFQSAMSQLGDVKGMVIDLRDCPGGQLDPAIQICQALAPDQPIGEIVVRSVPSDDAAAGAPVQTRTRQLDSASGLALSGLSFHGPISVLVDRGTANSAELLAAFLHDHVGARIVGTSTFGDAVPSRRWFCVHVDDRRTQDRRRHCVQPVRTRARVCTDRSGTCRGRRHRRWNDKGT